MRARRRPASAKRGEREAVSWCPSPLRNGALSSLFIRQACVSRNGTGENRGEAAIMLFFEADQGIEGVANGGAACEARIAVSAMARETWPASAAQHLAWRAWRY